MISKMPVKNSHTYKMSIHGLIVSSCYSVLTTSEMPTGKMDMPTKCLWLDHSARRG